MSKSELIFLDGRLLVLFCTVAEELHFGRAAARLFMTQPPLTQQIKRLEAIVGVPLFARTTRSVKLTPAGEIMYERARGITADTQLMLRQARRAARGETGALVIGITPSAASSPLVSALSHYRDAHPEVRIDLREMNSVDMESALRARVVDVALMRPHPLDGDIQTQVVHEEPLRVALRYDHALANRRDVSLEELLAYPLVGYRQDISPYFRHMIQELFAHAQLKPRMAQESVIPTLLTLVEAGVGPAIVPLSLSRMRADSLRFLPLRDIQGVKAQVVLAALRDQGNPAVEGFRAALAQSGARR
ncbi:HTH-type transcriptional regulator BenM [Achromobacter veterisilvae]|uniref:HTH-type transcriptional regulator BenM n=1 Tax=Achromobacter veterisilvae TaxID=2069367 RepID=A0A446CMN7_9BURK|nr:LysR substrate-binding domain-containing protein [Achromobacter veterisilvae]SSW69130.1 HTH-type transcriptional regulator BenM [Achromobacter veterisilvae]